MGPELLPFRWRSTRKEHPPAEKVLTFTSPVSASIFGSTCGWFFVGRRRSAGSWGQSNPPSSRKPNKCARRQWGHDPDAEDTCTAEPTDRQTAHSHRDPCFDLCYVPLQESRVNRNSWSNRRWVYYSIGDGRNSQSSCRRCEYIVNRGKEKLRVGEEYIVIGLTTQSDMRRMKQVIGKIYPFYEKCKFSTD